jgi:glutamate 5-kinase
LVSGLINADQLIILTNVDAVYTANPGSDPNAKRIEKVERLEQLSVIDTSGQSSLGRGGMSTKITAAKIAAFCGVQTSISSGLIDRPITSALKQSGGTHVQPQLAMSGKKRWIGFSSGYQGVITVNTFAVKALAEQKASLLAVGIVNAIGEFSEGEIVSICDPDGNEIGRGIANFNLESVNKVIGKHSSEVAKILGKDHPPEVIHRDNLVIYSEHEA